MGSVERSIAILTILIKSYSPMSYQEIRRELYSQYGELSDWRTVRDHVKELARIFDNITIHNGQRGLKNASVYATLGCRGKTIQSVIKSSLKIATLGGFEKIAQSNITSPLRIAA